MKMGACASLGLFILGAALLLVQLWASPWSPEVFCKIEITVGVLLLVSLVLFYVSREAAEIDDLKSGKDL